MLRIAGLFIGLAFFAFVMASAASPVLSREPGINVRNTTDLQADIDIRATWPEGHGRCQEYPIDPGKSEDCPGMHGFKSATIIVILWTPIIMPPTPENRPRKVATCRMNPTGPGNFRIVRQGSSCSVVSG